MSSRLGNTALAVVQHSRTRSAPRCFMKPGVERRYKASLVDVEIDHPRHSFPQGYNSASSSCSSSNTTKAKDKMTVDYNTLGMPTPPLSPKPGKKRKLVIVMYGSASSLAPEVSYPNITLDQDLLRLKHHLAQLPTTLLKHVHLQRVRRQQPNLFFAALADDINKLCVESSIHLLPVIY